MNRTESEQRVLHREDDGALVVEVHDQTFQRSSSGIWRYGGTSIPVPGSRDLLLRDVYPGHFVEGIAGSPAAVLLPERACAQRDELSWARRVGVVVEFGDHRHRLIPVELWEEHADQVVGLWAPEIHGTDAEIALVRAEKEFRMAQQAAEIAATNRAIAFARAAQAGVSRRRLAAVVDLSPTRVQQVIEGGLNHPLLALDDEERFVLEQAAASPHIEVAEIEGYGADSQQRTRAAVARLVDAGLIALGRTPDSIVITTRGLDVLHGRAAR